MVPQPLQQLSNGEVMTENTAEVLIQKTPFEHGLEVSLYGDDWRSYRHPKRVAQYEAGVAFGLKIIREMGGLAGFRKAMAETETLQARARESYAMLQRLIRRAKPEERDSLTAAIKLEPCADCRNIAICAMTGRVCKAFAQYVSHGWVNPAADRTPRAEVLDD